MATLPPSIGIGMNLTAGHHAQPIFTKLSSPFETQTQAWKPIKTG